MKSKKPKLLKWLVGTLGAILLGAVGSGVWEGVLKNLLTSLRDVLLNVISLGIKSFKDTAYLQIAKGFHEQSSLLSFGIILIFILMGGFALMSYLFFLLRRIKHKRAKILQKIDRDIKRIDSANPSEEDLKKEAKESLAKTRRELLSFTSRKMTASIYTLALSMIFMASFLVAALIRIMYVNSAITHYNQIYAIDSPYIDENKRREITSSFAQIKNREDYLSVVRYLEDIAKQNGKTVPEFSAW